MPTFKAQVEIDYRWEDFFQVTIYELKMKRDGAVRGLTLSTEFVSRFKMVVHLNNFLEM